MAEEIAGRVDASSEVALFSAGAASCRDAIDDGQPVFYIKIPYELYPLYTDEDETEAHLYFSLKDAFGTFLAYAEEDQDKAAMVKLLREFADEVEASIKIKPPESASPS